MPHTTAVRLGDEYFSNRLPILVFDEEQELEQKQWSRTNWKGARWLIYTGLAYWMQHRGPKFCPYPGRLKLRYPLKEFQGKCSGGFIVMQLAKIRDRRKRLVENSEMTANGPIL